MSDDEIAEFIERSRTATMATVLPDGRPHLVAMWYAVVDGEIWFETKAKSQKAANLFRDPTITVNNNGTGLFTFGAAILDVSNSNIAFNARAANGAWLSFGNNRGLGNTNLGTAPTAAGGAPSDLGQF